MSVARLNGPRMFLGKPSTADGSSSAFSMALRSASTAPVSPSMTRSREKNKASPSYVPSIMPSSTTKGAAMRASWAAADRSRTTRTVARPSLGVIRKTNGQSTGSMAKVCPACSPSREAKVGRAAIALASKRRATSSSGRSGSTLAALASPGGRYPRIAFCRNAYFATDSKTIALAPQIRRLAICGIFGALRH